jgi:indoleamine 2,3-dioxygenase
MRRYMLPPQRCFVEALEHGPSVRQFAIEHGASAPALRDRYNDCIRALEELRRRHVEIAVRYITHQAPKDVEAKGTGGTNFAAFLGKARKETGEREIT